MNRASLWVLSLVLFAGLARGARAQSTAFDVARLLEERTVAVIAQTERTFNLTLDDTIERALDRNLDIAVERVNPQVQDLSIAQANAVFLPTLTSDFDLSRRISPSRSQLDGAGRVEQSALETDTGSFAFGLGQAIKWSGGRYSIGWDNSRTESNNVFASFNPGYGANMSLSYTQPLLRGFGTDTQRRQLVVSQINRDIADIDLRETIANTLAAVRSAYWDLVYSHESVAVRQQALALAEQLVRDNRTRVEIGTLAPIDVVQAQAEAAARRQLLAQAELTLLSAELTLKRLIVNGTEDELWDAQISAVDQPAFEMTPVDVNLAIQTALDARTDVSRARRQLEINDATLENLRNSTLPSLDVIGSLQLQGQGGTQLISPVLGGPAVIEIPGGIGDALSDVVKADFPTWDVRVQLTYPLGQSAEKAAHARARLQAQQTQTQIRQLELQIATEVTNSALQIESIQEVIDAARAARELAEQQLAAEESKFEVGMSTNFFVVQAQRDLATAQDSELRAILDYQQAVIEFERVQQTSIGRAGISIVGGGG